jgi:hypothetical protein
MTSLLNSLIGAAADTVWMYCNLPDLENADPIETTLSVGGPLSLRSPHRRRAYRLSPVGALDKGLDEAKAKGWTVASMKDDWKTVFAPERK